MAPSPGVTRRGFLKALVAGAASPLFRFLPSKPSLDFDAPRDAPREDIYNMYWVQSRHILGIHHYEGLEHLINTGYRKEKE